MEPWLHLNKIEQIIGRGTRSYSHHLLPVEKRNITVYLHSSVIANKTLKKQGYDITDFSKQNLF